MKLVRRAVQIGALGTVIAAVTLFWIWRTRAVDAAPFSARMWEAVYAWGHRLVGVGWIDRYQTVIGGVLTLAAGTFLLVGIRDERSHRAREAAEREADQILSSFRAILSEIMTLQLGLDFRETREFQGPSAAAFTAASPLSKHYPFFYMALSTTLSQVRALVPLIERRKIHPSQDLIDNLDDLLKRVSGLLRALQIYVIAVDVYVSETKDLTREKMVQKDVEDVLRKSGATPETLRFVTRGLFEGIPRG